MMNAISNQSICRTIRILHDSAREVEDIEVYVCMYILANIEIDTHVSFSLVCERNDVTWS